jgi:CDP-glucose 4,6-dehydratase
MLDIMSQFPNLRSLDGPILLTGHTGFKGSWMSQVLNHFQFHTVGVSLPRDTRANNLLNNLSKIEHEFFQDISDNKKIKKLIKTIQPSVVIHMAAQPIVSESYSLTRETFETNVMGTVNILEALRDSPTVRCVAVITTDKVYQNSERGKAFIESDALGATDPYSASKVGTESAVMAYQEIYRTRDIPIISLRAGNVIGGGDLGLNRIIPDLVRSYMGSKVINVRNLAGVRPWQHVLDPIYGYLLAIEYALDSKKVESFNFGPPDIENLSVREVISIFEKALGPDVKFKVSSSNIDFHESKTLYLNSSKARNLLKWHPRYTGEEAVTSSAIWWKSVLSGASASETTKKEIERYFLNQS